MNGVKIYYANIDQSKAEVAILTSARAKVNLRKVIRDKEGHCILIKQLIFREDVTILNMCVPNN